VPKASKHNYSYRANNVPSEYNISIKDERSFEYSRRLKLLHSNAKTFRVGGKSAKNKS